MGRLLLVANRLPVTATLEGGRVDVEPSSGGLATGLRGPHDEGDSLWIGWPGNLPRLTTRQQGELDAQLLALRTVPIELSQAELRGFYEGISNSVLWPLFHYAADRLPLRSRDWAMYERVNERFADVVAEQYRAGDTIWVHDYQLALLPQMLRERIPEARIGFFLHIPFPSSEVFSVLPWRNEFLSGLLGSDLIGFHTTSYMRHFATSVARFLGAEVIVDRVVHLARESRLGVFPMGIDAEAFTARASSESVMKAVASIRQEAGGRKILVGIDRLDYTKGIPARLLALEQLLETHPELHDRVRLIQVTVPSRERVDAYAGLRRQIDEMVGRINSRFATANSVPIHNLYRALDDDEISALYRAADAMLVTPLRDGMNLVAKEFVASRPDDDGVLVLSEFAGAAAELSGAVYVNPHDIDAMAAEIARALALPRSERRERMRSMRERVFSYDVHRWTEGFLATLERATGGRTVRPATYSSQEEIAGVIDRARRAEELLVVMDYDGTLVPFHDTPGEAAPGPGTLDLLSRVAQRPGTAIHVVSGRTRSSLERWMGELPIGIHAEHGFWSRWDGGDWWHPVEGVSTDWKERVRPMVEHFTSMTPGSLIEEKTASIAWHYRMAKSDAGAMQAKELRILLAELLSNVPVEVIEGEMVIEIRPQGVNKGNIARALAAAAPNATVLAFGDDATDEDLFAGLPEDALTVHVGPRPSIARFRIAGIEGVHEMLEALASADGNARTPVITSGAA